MKNIIKHIIKHILKYFNTNKYKPINYELLFANGIIHGRAEIVGANITETTNIIFSITKCLELGKYIHTLPDLKVMSLYEWLTVDGTVVDINKSMHLLNDAYESCKIALDATKESNFLVPEFYKIETTIKNINEITKELI